MINPADACIAVTNVLSSQILSTHNYIESIPYMYRLFSFIKELSDNGIEKNVVFRPSFTSKTISAGVSNVEGREVTAEETEMRMFRVECDKFSQKATIKRLTKYFSDREGDATFPGKGYIVFSDNTAIVTFQQE